MLYDDMTTEEFLLTIKHFVELGHRHFVRRKERQYMQDLLELGIPSVEQAWREILALRVNDEYKPRQPDHKMPTIPVFFFKKEIGGKMAYIKLKFDAERGAVCLSFHPSE